MALAQKVDEKALESKKATLQKMKLLGKVWTGFFTESTFSTAAYRAMFIDLALADTDSDESVPGSLTSSSLVPVPCGRLRVLRRGGAYLNWLLLLLLLAPALRCCDGCPYYSEQGPEAP